MEADKAQFTVWNEWEKHWSGLATGNDFESENIIGITDADELTTPAGSKTETREILGKTKISDYRLKKNIIQNCIYGVDKNFSSVEIAKLRLWLSLIIEEDSLDHIEPLPNLEYKIVNGHSLIGVEQDLCLSLNSCR